MEEPPDPMVDEAPPIQYPDHFPEPPPLGAPVCPDSSLATAIEEGEVLIELPHGVIAKKSEYVWLSGLVEPDPPPGKVVKDDIIHTISLFLHLEGYSTDHHRERSISSRNQGKAYIVLLTAVSALDLLECGGTPILSARAALKAGEFALRFSLLDVRQQPYAELSNPVGEPRNATGREDYQNRLLAGAQARIDKKARTLVLYSSPPKGSGMRSKARLVEIQRLTRAALVCQYGPWASVSEGLNCTTAGGHVSEDMTWFICPEEPNCTLQSFVHCRRTAPSSTNPSGAALITDAAPEGMMPLGAIRWVDVGEYHPVIFSVANATAAALNIKKCCLGEICVASRRGGCNGLESFYEQKRDSRPARGPSSGLLGHNSRVEDKRQRQEQQQGLMTAAQGRIMDQRNALVQADPLLAYCPRWRMGRCAKKHPDRHGSESDTRAILCTSVLLPDDPKYSAMFLVCPFEVVTDERRGQCPYGGHWDARMEELEGNLTSI